MSRKQLDLFPDESPALSDPEQAPIAYSPDPEHVRQRLHCILAEAQAASVVPLGAGTPSPLSHHFPSDDPLAPDDEAGQVRFAFDEEMARLKAA